MAYLHRLSKLGETRRRRSCW